jgi:hypothetical protein
LRAAIQEANDTPNSGTGPRGGRDLIKFSIPGNGPHTIKPNSQLPEITEAVAIDGYTQGDATATHDDDARMNTTARGTNAVLKIELSGENAGEANGFVVTGGGTMILGLVINRFQEVNPGSIHGCGVVLKDRPPNKAGNVIAGNFIGTDVTGTQDLGNDTYGVLTFPESPDNRIGGHTRALPNIISGNGNSGVRINSNDNEVSANLIGTDKDTTGNLGNGLSGVAVAASKNVVHNSIIAFNASDGVTLFPAGTGNLLRQNQIFNNAGLGIDLVGGTENASGTTANDLGDPDTGANNLQNFPVIFSARTISGKTTIRGTLNSTPSSSFVIQFFSNDPGNEGKVYRGLIVVSTNSNGNTGSFTFSPTTKVPVGHTITATAANHSTRDTSEYSKAKAVE